MNKFLGLITATVAALTISNAANAGDTPSFSLAWSEYPSWSVFGVADELGLINGDRGALGSIEEKYNVDIVLTLADYDTCIMLYGSGQADAACLTNIDSLNAAHERDSVAVLPTSNSYGADAIIVTDEINSIQDLQNHPTYGLSLSVAEYNFVRNLEIAGENPSDYVFKHHDPGAAATKMQQSNKSTHSIAVWNPFVLATLERRDDVRVLFDSTNIENEIIDLVLVGEDVLNRDGGDRFAQAVCAAFYAVCERLEDESYRDDTLIALGERFSNLGLASMRTVVSQTRFYNSPETGVSTFDELSLAPIMKQVVSTSTQIGIIDQSPTIGYGDGDEALRFVTTYIEQVRD